MYSMVRQYGVVFLVWVILVLFIHTLHVKINYLVNRGQEGAYCTSHIPSPEVVKLCSGGFDRVLADLYWLMFVQYYGDCNACLREKYRQAPIYLELITRLDPHFIQPYWFASFILASELNLKKESEAVLNFGICENPNNWTLPYIAGFNQYLYIKNEKKAAYYYRLAAQVPGAPAWLLSQAKILEEHIPSQIKIIKTWQKIYDEATESFAREKARKILIQLWSKIYWEAPTKTIKARALTQLQALDADLLGKSQ